LPGQVHTYFGGSEHNVFRAYRQEVYQFSHWDEQDRSNALENVLRENGLKTTQQSYRYTVAGEDIVGTNVYGLLRGPRADATEAMVLVAAWRNFDGEVNFSGVALALTMARYFKRWSIWSKDIIVLIPADSTYGPEAWVSAYHSTASSVTPTRNVSTLSIKAGALQAAVALDYPVGPWGHRFDKLDIVYDGINGALPNLDLLNTAVSVASGQMGIGCSIHGMKSHSDSYKDRLITLAKGVASQSAGRATGPHSAFVPYHVDAITMKTVGDGWHDEMSLGRTTESVFRSVNNLLEHLHQSFFFYILLNSNRFVSIGNYLPAAMLIAGSFTITALALWVQGGRAPAKPKAKPGSTDEKGGLADMEVAKEGSDIALVPKRTTEAVERKMSLPAAAVLSVHLSSFVPLYLLNNMHQDVSIHSINIPPTAEVLTCCEYLSNILQLTTAASLTLPTAFSNVLVGHGFQASIQQMQIMQSFSLLLLGAALSTLATLNFSLAFMVGLLASPLAFVRPFPKFDSKALQWAVGIPAVVLHAAISPPVVIFALNWYLRGNIWDVRWLLLEMAKAWSAQGVYTSLVIWAVWWPAWVIGGIVLFSGVLRKEA